jgi:prephenate dehydrogenase
VVTDICGVKSGLYKKLAAILPDDANDANNAGQAEYIDYVGIHPMAGKERDGFENADPEIFKGSGMIICPLPSTRPESVELMKELAGPVGATRLCVSPPEKHDEIIAYTSDLMHISAAGLCMDYPEEMTLAFAAGAFRDSTRVADINAEAWTELLLDNHINTIKCLDRYMESLQRLRRCLAEEDAAKLFRLLSLAGDNKREMLGR